MKLNPQLLLPTDLQQVKKHIQPYQGSHCVMSISLFQDSSTYRDINSYTHRIRPPDVTAPALIWHTAYWIEDYYSENTADLKLRDFVKAELDQTICSTLQKLSSSTERVFDLYAIPSIDNRLVLFDSMATIPGFVSVSAPSLTKRQYDVLHSDSRAITFGFKAMGTSYRFRFELHTEYFTVTIIAEPIRTQSPQWHKLNAALILFRYLVGSRGNLENNLQQALNNYLYGEFWHDLFDFFDTQCGMAQVYNRQIFRSIFGDFRGLVVSEDHVSRLRRPVFGHEGFKEWGRQVADSLLGFISYGKRYEATASYVLDGRGLYITALGPQVGSNYNNIRSPVSFLLCIRQIDRLVAQNSIHRVQLGRLVSTFLLLGTVRVAALRDLRMLRKSGGLLGKFEPLIRSAQQQFRRIATDKSSPVELQDVMNRVYDEFGKIGAALVPRDLRKASDIGAAKGVDDILAPGGLQYRVERSRYYVAQFEKNIPHLRAERVEGYQTYDEFVQRRLQPAYDFIDRLGHRFERAVSVLSLIEQNYLALRTDKTERDLKDIAEKVSDIQTYGEVILLAVLVPYYLISTVHHIAHEPDRIPQAFQIAIAAVFIAGTAARYVP